MFTTAASTCGSAITESKRVSAAASSGDRARRNSRSSEVLVTGAQIRATAGVPRGYFVTKRPAESRLLPNGGEGAGEEADRFAARAAAAHRHDDRRGMDLR